MKSPWKNRRQETFILVLQILYLWDILCLIKVQRVVDWLIGWTSVSRHQIMWWLVSTVLFGGLIDAWMHDSILHRGVLVTCTLCVSYGLSFITYTSIRDRLPGYWGTRIFIQVLDLCVLGTGLVLVLTHGKSRMIPWGGWDIMIMTVIYYVQACNDNEPRGGRRRQVWEKIRIGNMVHG